MTGEVPPGHGMDLSADDLGMLEQLLAEQGVDLAPAETAIHPGARPARLPLSFAQEVLWLLDRSSPGLTAYKMPIVRRLVGPLDVTAFGQALSLIVARHETLRTRFPAIDGEPVQVIDPPAPVHAPVIDLRTHPTPQSEALRVVRELGARPFDLAADHLFRPILIRIAEGEHIFLLDTHHIAFDGWSRDVFFRELAAAYTAARRGGDPALPVLPIQFADFAVWQRRYLAGDRLAALLAFWRTQLGSALESPDLPTDYPRGAAPGFAGARARLFLPAAMLAEIKALGRRHDATLYMVLLAAYMTVLHRYSGNAHVLIGSGSAGRTQVETEGLIGYLNNTLVQRGEFTDDPSFAALLAQVRESALGAHDHQDVPLEKLMLELRQGQQSAADTPLFQAVLTMQDALEATLQLDDVELQPLGVDVGATKFDLTLFPSERDGGLWLTLQYRSDLYAPATADRLLGHLREILVSASGNAATRVSQLPMLSANELAALARWNDAAAPLAAPRAIHVQVAEHAAATPDAIALVAGEAKITYRKLDRCANRVAIALHAAGVRRGDPVGLLIDRSADAIVAMLGILKAGGAYVPLAPGAPPRRIAEQLGECAARVAVTRDDLRFLLPDSGVATLTLDGGEADVPPPVQVGADDCAYILFTSGSTGVPKGVVVTHGNVANYTFAIRRALELHDGAHLSFATVSTLAADLGNTAIFPALATGGTLHVIPDDLALDGPRFAAYSAHRGIDVLKITPSHLRALLAAAGSAAAASVLPRRWLVLGGEASSWELIDEVRRTSTCRIVNHYGPTEATIGCATFEVTPDSGARAQGAGAQTVPVGWPLANVQLHVLDDHRHRVPVAVPGELYVTGAGVARGYINRPELTSERFVELPGPGRAYCTGDRVRRLPDGALEFLGRIDDQVKIRGFRVELGEIEQTLNGFPGAAQSVVMLRTPVDADEPLLVAYVATNSGGYAAAHRDRPTADALRHWVASRLPDYMVPSVVILLEHLPLTANGKIDKRALPAPDAVARTHVPARTPTEETLVRIWSDALKRDPVGVRDNFFEIGGHSLIAIRVLGKLSRAFGVRLPLRTLFDAPTIEQLARLVDADPASARGEPGAPTIRAVARASRGEDAG